MTTEELETIMSNEQRIKDIDDFFTDLYVGDNPYHWPFLRAFRHWSVLESIRCGRRGQVTQLPLEPEDALAIAGYFLDKRERLRAELDKWEKPDTANDERGEDK